MNQHTPEPWSIDSEESPLDYEMDYWVTSDDLDRVCLAVTYANARRIVACVNACDGISTECLETRLVDPFTSVRGLTEQRDELLAALKEYIEAADETVRGEDGVAAMLRFGEADKAARAAIAKAGQS